MERKESRRGYAYWVVCKGKDSLGTVEFGIPASKIRNNDKICRYCPVRSRCTKHKNGTKLHFYAVIQKNPNVKLPLPVIHFR